MATLPWLAHLSRRELELLVTELARDLAERPRSIQRFRAEADLGCWRAVAEAYGSVGEHGTHDDGAADDS
ncbi:hypothetical protein [Xylanimonas ulmi]|uniref:Uncharacterized protein n=1 Tax=Xylanimonas ulmi TaxID=228973 RepID=A0A4Q7M111_9MICO|nr:hypothetical protein [Xylanibacterium ulmi]RZS61074.1 hypothetical protein EV386_1362 [Xylanibacterium ulmi]